MALTQFIRILLLCFSDLIDAISCKVRFIVGIPRQRGTPCSTRPQHKNTNDGSHPVHTDTPLVFLRSDRRDILQGQVHCWHSTSTWHPMQHSTTTQEHQRWLSPSSYGYSSCVSPI